MKKTIVSLLALTLLSGAAAASAAVPSISVKKAPADVKIDGVLDDQWKNATVLTVGEKDATTAAYGKVWGKAAEDCKISLMWDSSYLYFFAEKTDGVVCAPITDTGAGAPWLDDSIGMFMAYPDGSGFKSPISVPTEDGELLMGWAPIGPGSAEIRPEIGAAKVVKTSTGYKMECKLKWAEIGEYTPKVGDVVKFTPLIMDRDDETGTNGDEWGQTMWAGDGDNPEVYADLKFVD